MTLRARQILQVFLVVVISAGIFIWWLSDFTSKVKENSADKLLHSIDQNREEVKDIFKENNFINSTTTAELWDSILQTTSTVTTTE